MEEPSNARPSVKDSSSTRSLCTVRCCHLPWTSANFRSISSIPSSLIWRRMSCGVLAMEDGMDEEQNPERTEHLGPSVYRLIQKIGGSVQVTVSVKSSKSNWEQALRW